jgi:hypothetical protein
MEHMTQCVASVSSRTVQIHAHASIVYISAQNELLSLVKTTLLHTAAWGCENFWKKYF